MFLVYHFFFSYKNKHKLLQIRDITSKRIPLDRNLIVLIKSLILLPKEVKVILPIWVVCVPIAIVVVVPKGWSFVLLKKWIIPQVSL